MADLSTAVNRVLSLEGGWRLTNIPGDAGGRTYAGISERAHPTWSGWTYINSNDLANPALHQAVLDLYREEYWQKIGGQDLTCQALANHIFDFAVVAGVKSSSMLAQGIAQVKVDGDLGPVTVAALNELSDAMSGTEPTVVKLFRLEVVRFFALLVNRDHTQMQFLLGWLNRSLAN